MTDKKYPFDWVLQLPQVDPDTTAKHAEVRKLCEQADELVAEAERLQEQAKEVRGKAYRESLNLESRARSIWPAATVESLKQQS